MNGIVKWLLRTAAVLAGIGALLAVAGWALGGQTKMDVNVAGRDVRVGMSGFQVLRTDKNEDWEKSDIMELSPFEELEIDIQAGDVYLRPGDGYGLSLSTNVENYKFDYENKDGKLKVWSNGVHLLDFSFGGSIHASVTVYYPRETELHQLTVKTELGQVDMSDLSARVLDLTASLGEVELTGITLGQGTLVASLGDLELEEVKAQWLDLTLSMGEFKGSGITTTQELTIENHMGDTSVEGALYGKTKVISSMGNVTLTSSLPQEDYGYDLSTSMGDVRLNGAHMDEKATQRGGTHHITVENSMGDITLKLR